MIVKVSYYKPEYKAYSARGYTYRTELPLKVGDKVIAPTVNGEQKALVTAVNLPESVINPAWSASVKTIAKYDRGEAEA